MTTVNGHTLNGNGHAANGNGHASIDVAPSTQVKTVHFSSKHPDLTLLYLDAATPAPSSSNKPLIFYIHGGGFVVGDAYLIPAHLIALAQNMGAALVSVNYRLCPEVGIRNGVEDVEEAWQYVFKGGLGQSFEPSKTLIVGASAGSHYAVQMLLTMDPAAQPAAFLNIYGAVGVDVSRYGQPIPQSVLPHPLLDMPGGFPPLNQLIHSLYDKPVGASDNVSEWPAGASLKSGLPQPSEVRLGVLDQLLAKEKIDHPEKWEAFWAANGLSTSLYGDLQAGVRMKPEDIARSLLLPWGFRTGNFVEMLRDADAGQTLEESDVYLNITKRLQGADPASTGRLPPTMSVHGSADVLVPPSVSEGFHAVMKARGEESELLIVEGKEHGFDCGEWVFGQDDDVRKVDTWVRAKLGVTAA